MSVPACALRGVWAGYAGGPDVLSDVDLEVPAGETVAVLGPSGGGKSTLLKVIAGLLPARRGTVQVLGQARPPRGSIGYIPQRLGLVRHATALENALQGGLHETPAWRSLTRRPAAALVARAHAALEQVGLGAHAEQVVHRLSGGQQRRVATARALVQRPRLLLADEFLGELDPATVDIVLHAVRALVRDHGTTVLLVEHHLDQAQRLAGRVLRVEAGRLHDVAEVPA